MKIECTKLKSKIDQMDDHAHRNICKSKFTKLHVLQTIFFVVFFVIGSIRLKLSICDLSLIDL